MRLGLRERSLELGARLAAERLSPELPLELDGVGGLDEHGVADLVREPESLIGRTWMPGAGNPDSSGLGDLELEALALDALERRPVGKRTEVAVPEGFRITCDRVQSLVVRREDRRGRPEHVTELHECRDEPLLVHAGVRGVNGDREA